MTVNEFFWLLFQSYFYFIRFSSVKFRESVTAVSPPPRDTMRLLDIHVSTLGSVILLLLLFTYMPLWLNNCSTIYLHSLDFLYQLEHQHCGLKKLGNTRGNEQKIIAACHLPLHFLSCSPFIFKHSCLSLHCAFSFCNYYMV